MARAADIINDTTIIESRKQNDTIRLWENHRDQAALWRAIALLQIPGMALVLILCMMLWSTNETIINVPAKPLPGLYAAEEIPDAEFIEAATSFINLTASYRPPVARIQFLEAQKMLVEPMLSQFNGEMMKSELQTIETTDRTQMMYVDPTQTQIERTSDGKSIVTLTGERLKVIAGRSLPSVPTTFRVTLSIIPRTSLNPYGIVIEDVSVSRSEEK